MNKVVITLNKIGQVMGIFAAALLLVVGILLGRFLAPRDVKASEKVEGIGKRIQCTADYLVTESGMTVLTIYNGTDVVMVLTKESGGDWK